MSESFFHMHLHVVISVLEPGLQCVKNCHFGCYWKIGKNMHSVMSIDMVQILYSGTHTNILDYKIRNFPIHPLYESYMHLHEA